MTTATLTQPPDVLKMLVHDLRWQIVGMLARSDRRVGEIISQVGQPANLVSYHLRLLRDAGLVEARRSDADGRDMYYHLNLATLRSSYFNAGERLHPALHMDPDCLPPTTLPAGTRPRILFACTHNSARSQMAEGLLRQIAGDTVEVVSAGSQPTGVHPLAVQVMAERGIDISRHESKGFEAVADRTFDTLITVCDRAREVCPVFADHPEDIHWSLPDPSEVRGSDEERYQAFAQTADDITDRIQHLVEQLSKEAD